MILALLQILFNEDATVEGLFSCASSCFEASSTSAIEVRWFPIIFVS